MNNTDEPNEDDARTNRWILIIGITIWLYVTIAAFVPVRTRAENDKIQTRKCNITQMALIGAVEMFEFESKEIVTTFDTELLEMLKNKGYAKEDISQHALNFIKLKNGKIFCLEHGAYEYPNQSLSPREQLKELGESNHDLLMSAKGESSSNWVRNYGDPNLSRFGETVLWIICSFFIAGAIDKDRDPLARILLIVFSAAIAAIFLYEHLAILRTYL